MNREELIKAGVNYEDGVKRFAGKPEIYEKYLLKFFVANPVKELCKVIEENDMEKAFRIAHDLKGNTGSLSLTGIYEVTCKMVELLRSGKTEKQECMVELQQIINRYELAEQALKTCLFD